MTRANSVRRILTAALAFGVLACDRPTGPASGVVAPANVPMLSVLQAIDVTAALSTKSLLADPYAACGFAPIQVNLPGQRNPGILVTATKLPDGSLVRFRGGLSATGKAGDWLEMTRDWKGTRGIRVGQRAPGQPELWVLRYGAGRTGRVSDERETADPAALAAFDKLRARFEAFECPQQLHRFVDHSGLIVR